ncbi:carbohydrate ABC transporter permease [uncultured Robinsoniella sp.]|uniref:carbohydrate ABC transporter permease n=1 Tax=uncultured Robinsoniella sp. TaxID=904190 RepID=UPI00374F74F0
MKKIIRKRPFIFFLVPGFILYSIFVIYPIFAAGQLSLYQWNGIGKKIFVGINNYVELFTNADLMAQMMNALKNSLTIFVLTVLIAMPIQIIMAYMIFSKAKGKNYFQVAIFSPQFISTPVIVFIFTLIFDGNIGIVNKFLEMVGLGALTRSWLGIPQYGIYIIWAMITWAGIGVGMMYFIGAMKMIGMDSLESAYLEGAGFWRRLWYIIIPQVKMTILNLVLVGYIVSMTIFDYSYIMGGTSGGINGNVDVMSLFFYRMAFGDTNPLGGNISSNSIGMGTTIACVLFLMIFVIALLQMLIVYRKEEE